MIHAPRRERTVALLETCSVSAIVQLIMMAAVFIALPILFYAVVGASQSERDDARLSFARERAALIAAGLAPALENATPADADQLADHLNRYAAENQTLKVFFRPPASTGSAGIFFIAGAPQASAEHVRTTNEALQAAGVFERLIERCDNPAAAPAVVLSTGAALTILTRVHSPYGCWGIVTAAATSAGVSFWANPALKIIALVYAGIVALTLASTASLLFNLRRARYEAVSAQARFEPSPSLLQLNRPLSESRPEARPDPAPAETATVKPDFDEVEDIAPLEAGGPHDAFAAALMDTVRTDVNLSEIVRTHIEAERKLLEQGDERLTADIAEDVVIHGRADFVATILDELIGNALGTEGSAHVVLGLQQGELRPRALLTVVYDNVVAWPAEVFGRLALIKQFVTALGGVSASETREDGGVTIRVALPA